MAQPELDVWMNGEHVGTWFWSRTGTAGFRYADAWVASAYARPLSLSLPIPAAGNEVLGPRVENWFDNLLPDSQRIRERLRRRFRLASTSAADLLAAIGRDCVGAVQLMPAGMSPPPVDRIDGEPLTDARVEALLANITSNEPGADGDADLRISIAGAQEKTALLRIGGRWHKPLGATPTTHILKLPLGLIGGVRADMSLSVENEWLCAQILSALGFTVARTEMASFGARKVLVVERFDRRSVDGGRWIARLPQEDMCQALGMPAELKYESDGGPGMAALLRLLSGSEDALGDKLRFIFAQLAFWLLAGIDGHAKNFSIFLGPGGSFRLTPLYDVLSAWPIIGDGPNQFPLRRARMAMPLRSKNPHYNLREIHVRHWRLLAQQSGVPDAFDLMVRLVRSAPLALEQVHAVLPKGFPQSVWKPIRGGVLAHAAQFERELAPA